MNLLTLAFFFLLLVNGGDGHAASRTDADRKAALTCTDARNAEALAFGLRVQNAVRAQDLAAFFALVEGELERGPRRRHVQGKAFAEVFPESWRQAVLAAKPSCAPVGGRGFMLGRGQVWYRPGGVFAVNGWLPQEAPPMLGGWRFDGDLLPPSCFAYQSPSGDVFEDFARRFSIADGRNDPAFADFEGNPGRHFGSSVRSFDANGTGLWRHVRNCVKDSGQLKVAGATVIHGDGERYAALASVPRQLCQSLAPNLPGECLQSRLLHRFSLSDGSMGYYGVHGLYGLFRMQDGARIVFPLRYFGSESLARSFLDNRLVPPEASAPAALGPPGLAQPGQRRLGRQPAPMRPGALPSKIRKAASPSGSFQSPPRACVSPTHMFLLRLWNADVPTIREFSRFILDAHPTTKGQARL